MSNVLIGIIGVILFIGLALAGALFLGPRFQEATLNSTASSLMQIVQQTAHATALRETNTSNAQATDMTIADSLVADGYLKTAPYNPTVAAGLTGDFAFPLRAVANEAVYGTTGTTRARVILMRIGDLRQSPDLICTQIQRRFGKSSYDVVTTQIPSDVAGCFRAGPDQSLVPGTAITSNNYYVFMRF